MLEKLKSMIENGQTFLQAYPVKSIDSDRVILSTPEGEWVLSITCFDSGVILNGKGCYDIPVRLA